MKVKTKINPKEFLGAEKVEEHLPGIWYCYGFEKNGRHELLAIVHETQTGEYIVDAESDIVILVPSATVTEEAPNPLYSNYVLVNGREAVWTGPKITTEYFRGHKVLKSVPSKLTWEQIRKREYQIAKPKEESKDDLIAEIERYGRLN